MFQEQIFILQNKKIENQKLFFMLCSKNKKYDVFKKYLLVIFTCFLRDIFKNSYKNI